MKGLGIRTVSGAVLLVIVLAAIWLRGPLLMVLVAAAAALAAHEMLTMARKAGYTPWYPAGMALALLFALRGYLGGDILTGVPSQTPGLAPEVMGVALVLLFTIAAQGYSWLVSPVGPGLSTGTVMHSPRSPYLAWADLGLTLGAALYTGGLLGYAPMIAALPETPGHAGGSTWLLLVVLGTAASDTGAYVVGSAIGRHKMIPWVSPGKTWEGLVGGAIASVLVAVVFSWFLHLTLAQAVVLGLLICAAAVTGDLCESLMKRASGVKDSGKLIPGHGGILDRLDSILFVLLAVYWFIQIAGLVG